MSVPVHAIRALQQLLNAHGEQLEVDGRYGPRTDAAVLRQLDPNLPRADAPPSGRPIDRLVVHCAATRRGEDEHVNAAEIRRWHRARGWDDIGYHYVIRRDGAVEIGRPLDEVGAHARGHNTGSIGICLVGGYDRTGLTYSRGIEDMYTAAQIEALRTLLGDLLQYWPQAEVLGHRDLPNVNKACPSFDVIAWWNVQ